jgi:hypothetical protein
MIPHAESRRSHDQCDDIRLVYPSIAITNSTGYTTNATAGNGTPNTNDAVLLKTLLQERVALISQNEGPLNCEYACNVR